jgi:hypothetical protein
MEVHEPRAKRRDGSVAIREDLDPSLRRGSGCENAGATAAYRRAVTPLSQEVTHVAQNGGCRDGASGPLAGSVVAPAESANPFHCVMFHRALFEGTAAGDSTSAEAQAKAGLWAFDARPPIV